jgi:hypothetical protein
MDDWKNFFASRTIWSNLVGLAALLLGAFGFDLGAAEQEGVVVAVGQIVAGGCFLASTVFRVLATRKLSV